MKVAFFGDINNNGQFFISELVNNHRVELSYISLCCNNINIPDISLFDEYLSDTDKIIVALDKFDMGLLKKFENKTIYVNSNSYNDFNSSLLTA